MAFALAWQIRSDELHYFPLFVVAAPLGCLAANWASPVLIDEKRLTKHFAVTGLPYVLAMPLAALADVAAVPQHWYVSVLGFICCPACSLSQGPPSSGSSQAMGAGAPKLAPKSFRESALPVRSTRHHGALVAGRTFRWKRTVSAPFRR